MLAIITQFMLSDFLRSQHQHTAGIFINSCSLSNTDTVHPQNAFIVTKHRYTATKLRLNVHFVENLTKLFCDTSASQANPVAISDRC